MKCVSPKARGLVYEHAMASLEAAFYENRDRLDRSAGNTPHGHSTGLLPPCLLETSEAPHAPRAPRLQELGSSSVHTSSSTSLDGDLTLTTMPRPSEDINSADTRVRERAQIALAREHAPNLSPRSRYMRRCPYVLSPSTHAYGGSV